MVLRFQEKRVTFETNKEGDRRQLIREICFQFTVKRKLRKKNLKSSNF